MKEAMVVVKAGAVAMLVFLAAGCPDRSGTEGAASDAADAGGTEAASAVDAGATAPGAADAASEAAPVRLGPPSQTAGEMVPGDGPLWAVIDTTKGDIVVRLFEEQAPITVANFVGLASGRLPYESPDTGETITGPFYENTIFHRVIPDFMIQAGDPTGTGRGGPGYRFADESQDLRFDKPGLVAMANAGPNTNGSQFFITERPTPHLTGRHTIFGEVVSGMQVVNEIARVRTGPGNRPIEPIKIERVEITRAAQPPKAGG